MKRTKIQSLIAVILFVPAVVCASPEDLCMETTELLNTAAQEAKILRPDIPGIKCTIEHIEGRAETSEWHELLLHVFQTKEKANELIEGQMGTILLKHESVTVSNGTDYVRGVWSPSLDMIQCSYIFRRANSVAILSWNERREEPISATEATAICQSRNLPPSFRKQLEAAVKNMK